MRKGGLLVSASTAHVQFAIKRQAAHAPRSDQAPSRAPLCKPLEQSTGASTQPPRHAPPRAGARLAVEVVAARAARRPDAAGHAPQQLDHQRQVVLVPFEAGGEWRVGWIQGEAFGAGQWREGGISVHAGHARRAAFRVDGPRGVSARVRARRTAAHGCRAAPAEAPLPAQASILGSGPRPHPHPPTSATNPAHLSHVGPLLGSNR